MDESGKTRIQIPGRSAGDGMENSSLSAFVNKKWTSNHETSFNNFPNKNFIPPPAKLKGPKFVPYEPYKAAVSPILSSSNWDSKRCTSKFVIDSQKVSSLASSIIELYSNLENKENYFSSSAEEKKCECSLEINALKEKIKLLEKENKELNSQHQVQIEVNADLKKMLVASLGEDVQCKVQYMTEDKALLGKEVLQLADELERSREERDQLSALSSVWESKFKASSLMVKELAEWKASLSHKLNECISALDSVLKEHDVLYEQLYAAYSILEQTLDAFDPSAKQLPRKQLESWPSILKLSMQTKSLATSIQERLIGGKMPCNIKYTEVRQLTRAENLINQLFESFDILSSPVKDVSKDPGRVACQVLPHSCDSTVNYCKHCSGKTVII